MRFKIGFLSLAILLWVGVMPAWAQVYKVGDLYTAPDGSQGIVYWLNPDGSGGWVVALNDASTGCAWGTATDIADLANQDPGSNNRQQMLNDTAGYAHTQAIRAYQNNDATTAAGVVNFVHGWYLPSPAQLSILYGQLPLIESALTAAGGATLTTDNYWCSAEQNSDNAWVVTFNYGYFQTSGKTGSCRVRAVRSFTYPSADGVTYVWNTGATGSDITVSSAGTYSVTATYPQGCSDADTVTVVQGLPAGDARPCPGHATVTDYDGNVYNTVQIGNQCWMRENMRTKHFADGSTVPTYYAPNNDTNYVASCGYYYNWSSAMHGAENSSTNPSGVQGICPTGWHVPSLAEWEQLTNYVSGIPAYLCNGSISKALCASNNWESSSTICSPGCEQGLNNITNFSMVPSGGYNYGYKWFGIYAFLWTTTHYDYPGSNNYNHEVIQYYTYDHFYTGYGYHGDSYPVRCLLDVGDLPAVSTTDVSDVSFTTTTCGGVVTYSGGSEVTARGVCWSTLQNPTIGNMHTNDGIGTGVFTSFITNLEPGTTYYVRAYATNIAGTSYGEQITFITSDTIPAGDAQPCPGTPTVTDYDGNVYNTVKIGQQCWMRENLRATHFVDGVEISSGSSASGDIPYRYAPDNDEGNVPIYGYLYNWPAVMHGASSSGSNPSGVQGICPTGWHVPSNDEWSQLIDYISSVPAYMCNGNSSYVAKSLSATTGWAYNNSTCVVGNDMGTNNATGFSSLPVGGYTSVDYWSSTEFLGGSVWRIEMMYFLTNFQRVGLGKHIASSLRCVLGAGKNPPAVTTSVASGIGTTSAISGGNVTADGGGTVTARGVCWNTTGTPTLNDNHTTDGTGTGTFTSSITGLTTGTTYYVRAYATNSVGTGYGEEVTFTTLTISAGDSLSCPGMPTVTDYDGNVYNTVQIGNQCWMRENLRTTHYADGTTVVAGNAASYTVPYRYDYTASNIPLEKRGYLYNWPAAMHGAASSSSNPSSVQGVCPTGWHLPSDAEWSQLINYVGSVSAYWCNGSSSYIAKSLSSTESWTVTTSNCRPGNGQESNNATGFGAYPVGYYCTDGFLEPNIHAAFWSATETATNTAGRYYLSNSNTSMDYAQITKRYGLSVRCVLGAADSQPCTGHETVSDYDGNVYNTIQLGNQCWMKENLRTTHFADGVEIPASTTVSSTEAYRHLSGSNPVATYGYLYNWTAVMHGAASSSANPSAVQGVCPAGWHVPSDAEWTQLTDYLSSQSRYVCGDNSSNIAKALAATTGWAVNTNSNTTCTVGGDQSTNNATGFGAMQAGGYFSSGYSSTTRANLWSCTQSSDNIAWYRYLSYLSATVGRNNQPVSAGYSVRCLLGAGNTRVAAVGDILCTDGTWVSPSDYAASGKTAMGVIFHVDDSGYHGWAVNPSEYGVMAWGGYGTDIPTLPNSGETDTAGYSNTQIIRSFGDASTYPAAWWVDFNNGWYLPAARQLLMLYEVRDTVNATLSIIGGTVFGGDGQWWCWSSTEAGYGTAWALTYQGSLRGLDYKGAGGYRVYSIRSF